jgi:hypothetical protein
MNTFKTIDVYIQVALIAIFTILSIVKFDSTFITGYFAVGSYQFVSMIVHECGQWFTIRGGSRRVYHNTTYVLVVCMALTPLVYVTGIVFLPLLFIAPLLAVYYTWLCYRETFVYMKRPLSVLK